MLYYIGFVFTGSELARDPPSLQDIAVVPVTCETAEIQRKLLEPTQSALLAAMTPKSANETFNLERVETLGDSALKFFACLHLFLKYPLAAEGPLSSVKCDLNQKKLFLN